MSSFVPTRFVWRFGGRQASGESRGDVLLLRARSTKLERLLHLGAQSDAALGVSRDGHALARTGAFVRELHPMGRDGANDASGRQPLGLCRSGPPPAGVSAWRLAPPSPRVPSATQQRERAARHTASQGLMPSAGIISTSSSWTATGGTTTRRPSALTRSATSTTGSLCAASTGTRPPPTGASAGCRLLAVIRCGSSARTHTVRAVPCWARLCSSLAPTAPFQQQQQHQQASAATAQQQQQHHHQLLAQAQLHPAQHPALRANGPGVIAAAAGGGGGGGLLHSCSPPATAAHGAAPISSSSGGATGVALSHPVLNHVHVHNSISANSVAAATTTPTGTATPSAATPTPPPDVDMANGAAHGGHAPVAIHNPKEPVRRPLAASAFALLCPCERAGKGRSCTVHCTCWPSCKRARPPEPAPVPTSAPGARSGPKLTPRACRPAAGVHAPQGV